MKSHARAARRGSWPGRCRGSGSRPCVGATRLRIMRASVVLPLPDSPTMVKISGRAGSSEKLTSSTALKAPRAEQAAHGIGLGDVFDGEERLAHRSASAGSARCSHGLGPRGSRRSRRRDGRARASSAPGPRAGRSPWRAGSADGSGSPAAASARFGGAPASAFFGLRSPIRGRLCDQVRGVGVERVREDLARSAPPRPAGRHT